MTQITARVPDSLAGTTRDAQKSSRTWSGERGARRAPERVPQRRAQSCRQRELGPWAE